MCSEWNFALFVPHRDCRKYAVPLKEALFSTGCYGAFSFPFAVPLALLSRPLLKSELKSAAVLLRRAVGNNFAVGDEWAVTCFGGLRFGGQRLLTPILAQDDFLKTLFPHNAVAEFCPLPLLTAAILRDDGLGEHNEDISFQEKRFLDEFKNLKKLDTFTAGYAANLEMRALSDDGCSFEWRVTESAWMPRAG